MTANASGLQTIARPSGAGLFPMSPALPPAVTLVVGAAASHRYGLYPTLNNGDLYTMASAVASIGGTMLGFMLAALAVLASINDTHLVRMMKRTGHYRDLLLTLFTGALACLLCVVLGYLMLFGATASAGLRATLVGAHLAALVSLLDIGRKFWLVLVNLRSEP